MTRTNPAPCQVVHLLALLWVVLAHTACTLPSSGNVPIAVSGETLVVAWDPPRHSVPTPPLAIDTYRIYYSPHGAECWTVIGEIRATENPSFTLRHADYGDGAYDFAVSAIDGLRIESALHTSLDAEANPFGGWYVIWIKSD